MERHANVTAMACDLAALQRLPWPTVETRPATTSMVVEKSIGVRAAFRSAHAPSAWYAVLKEPETQDEWQAEDFGVKRVDRLDHEHIYQRIDLAILFGAFHIREQLVVRIQWASTEGAVRSCWQSVDPAPWSAAVPAWDARWETQVRGGWDVEPLEDGGSRVSYQVWAPQEIVFPGLQQWAMARTLPKLLTMFEERVGTLASR
jgi:hypothetical protein